MEGSRGTSEATRSREPREEHGSPPGPWRRIVAAVDGTPSSFDAALLAGRLARLAGCGVHLICTMPRPERPKSDPEGEPTRAERCSLALASAQAAIGRKVPVVEREVRTGPAAETILAYAKDVGADLICTGKGRHRLRIGSVAGALLRHAPIPVAIVREGAINSPALCRFLVGVDGSASADRAAALAAEFAQRAEGSFTAVSVIPTSRIPPGGLSWDDEAAAELRATSEGRSLVAAVEGSVASGNERSAALFLPGQAVEGLLLALQEQRADLLVLGTGRHEGAKRLLGSTAERIVSRAPRPVLVVR